MATEPEVTRLVQLLSRYLRSNPHACDTVDAIARWWLQPDASRDTASLEAALHRLERLGLVESLHAADGRVRYRRIDAGPGTDAKLDALSRPGTAPRGGPAATRH